MGFRGARLRRAPSRSHPAQALQGPRGAGAHPVKLEEHGARSKNLIGVQSELKD